MSEFLVCDRCSEKFEFPHLDKRFYYDGEVNSDGTICMGDIVRVIQIPVWCYACNAAEYAEYCPETVDIEIAISINKTPEGISWEEPIEDRLLCVPVESLREIGIKQTNRLKHGRCLSCGGYQYHRIDVYNRSSPVHRNCGGSFKYGLTLASAYYFENVYLYDYEGNLKWKGKRRPILGYIVEPVNGTEMTFN